MIPTPKNALMFFFKMGVYWGGVKETTFKNCPCSPKKLAIKFEFPAKLGHAILFFDPYQAPQNAPTRKKKQLT